MVHELLIVTPPVSGVTDSAPEMETAEREENECESDSPADASGDADNDDSDSQQSVFRHLPKAPITHMISILSLQQTLPHQTVKKTVASI